MLLWILACRLATPVDACADDASACVACTDDAECAYTGNACLDTVYCAHQDASIAVAQLGCSAALEHRWPDPSTCVCRSTCTLLDD
jgi:hypothetical protein